ncbi:MAG: thioredoxin family protein [Ignavibacterium sp.]|nr:thioredoxin family protein [Ignavibacterium sp.]
MRKLILFTVIYFITVFDLKAEPNIFFATNLLLSGNLQTIQNAQRFDTDSVSIINFNFQYFKELLSNSNKEYHLVVLFAEWCKPCTEIIPVIDSITSEFQNLICYYVYPDTEKNIKFLNKYLNNQFIIRKVYFLDNTYKGNVKKRFIAFKNQVCTDCENNVGFPTVILMNKNMKVLFKATGDIEGLRDFLIEN